MLSFMALRSALAKGTPKSPLFSQELDKVISMLSSMDSSIQIQSIKDLHRLGKYNQDRRRSIPDCTNDHLYCMTLDSLACSAGGISGLIEKVNIVLFPLRGYL